LTFTTSSGALLGSPERIHPSPSEEQEQEQQEQEQGREEKEEKFFRIQLMR